MPRLGSDLPLFARDAELASLRETLDAARAGRPATVLVSGDAGVGKTRLLHEFNDSAGDGVRTVTGHCLDTADSALPYLPFAEIVGTLARDNPALVTDHPGLRPLLPGHPTAADGDLGRLGLFEAFHAALADLSAEQTLVLTLEDLHWADRSSRDLLAFLTSRLTAQRVLILGTYRADALHRGHPLRPLLAELVRLPAVQRLHLDPFDAQHAVHFVRELHSGLDEETVTKIAAASEGNAFLAEELAAAETHTVTFELAEVLLARLERLPEAAKQVVQLASVMGRRFTYRRLNAAAWKLLDDTGLRHERELDEALRAAISHGIIVQKNAEVYAFRHALLGEAVYSDLLPGERIRYHQRIAESLAEDHGKGAAAELAHHSYESGDLACALSASVRAADEAVELAAPAEALLHLERALSLFGRVPAEQRPEGLTELRLTLRAAANAEASGEIKRAQSYSAAAVRLADASGDPIQGALARRKYAKHLLTTEGDEQEAQRVAWEAWELVKDDEPHAVKAWAQAVLARTCFANRRYEEAAVWTARAIATADTIAASGEPVEGDAHIAAKADAILTDSLAAYRRGDQTLERTIERQNEALALVRGLNWPEVELRAHFDNGLAMVDAGRLVEALEHFDRGVERARHTGDKWSAYGLETAVRQVICNYMLGRWDEVDANGEMASSVLPGVVLTRLAAAVLLVDVARGRFDTADRRLDYLADRWQLDGQVLALAALCGAELDRWRGRPDEALRRVERATERITRLRGYYLAGISVCAAGVGAAADLAQRLRRDGDAAGAKDAVAAGERLAERARFFLEHGRPLSGTLGPEGRAWVAQLDAEESRLYGDGDPDLWRAAAAAFDYRTALGTGLPGTGAARAEDGANPGSSAAPVLGEQERLELALRDPVASEALALLDAAGKTGGPGDGPYGGAWAEPYRQAYAHWRLAEALLAAPGAESRTEAAAVLADAKATAIRLGAGPLAAELCALAERARLDTAMPTSTPLTPRELAVLRQVARGLTNRQIGAELYISEKTVSVHLSRAMAKLQVAGRAAAVNAAHLRGYLTEG
ncbi:LuxR family transcriptional regulator [Glycomyces sp. TRM65418]|uniref:helix-turn-helix transcriptional regulator n=1 Tax=Glycomyces sp. TRM65418 TaxID=2867006 RepID=UPI001CE54A46|nr:LuxR family transcriptional regulator [Glycomyces sp. TRM65418]QZD53933.1 AAA family ATPase [Glycomyces sp. TRM65418]